MSHSANRFPMRRQGGAFLSEGERKRLEEVVAARKGKTFCELCRREILSGEKRAPYRTVIVLLDCLIDYRHHLDEEHSRG